MNKPIILGLGFQKQSGKTTAAEHLAGRMQCRVRPLSARIYAIAHAILDQPIEESDKSREIYGDLTGRAILQNIGTWLGREFGPDFIINASLAMQDIAAGCPVVIPDVRMPAEANAIRANGGHLWKIQRDWCDINQRDSHITESGDGIEWDRVIPNNGTLAEFKNKLDFELNELLEL
jgi:hypothetical protein